MMAPLALSIASFFTPLLALLAAVFTFQFCALTRFRISWVFAFAIPLAFIVCSREIPAYPSDDLENYFSFYKDAQLLSLSEIWTYSRFEPIFFLIYKALGGAEITVRGLLFVHALLCSVALVSAALLVCQRLGLSTSVFCMSLFFFPYELVSNTPRLVFAASVFIVFIELRSPWRYFFLVAALLSHKFIYFLWFVYVLSTIFHSRRALVSFVPLLFVFAISLLPYILNLPLFNRVRYYFLVPDLGGYSLMYFAFAIPFLLAIWNKRLCIEVKAQAVFFYSICMLAFAVSPFGALGDRMGQPVWMPFVFFLFLFLQFKRDLYSQVFFLVAPVGLVLVRLLIFSNFEGHKPFSEYQYMSFYPLTLIYTYLVSPF